MNVKFALAVVVSVAISLSAYGQGHVITRKTMVTAKAKVRTTKKSTKAASISTAEMSPLVVFSQGIAVDLGLPSGTLWADRNLGALSPTDKGDIYAWGKNIKTKSNISTIYFNIGGWDLNIAPTQISDNWTLPTADQFYELATACQFVEFKDKGIDCYKVIGPNGNFILLPKSTNSDGDECFWTSTITDYSYSINGVSRKEKRPVAYSSTVSDNRYKCPIPQDKHSIRPVKLADEPVGSKKPIEANSDEEGKYLHAVFDVVDQMPSFPGGTSGVMKYLSENIKYPVVAQKNGVQGRVVVSFVVERDGSITDVKVARSVDPSLDREAMRVVRCMPHGIPGKQNGSTVRVKYSMPISFRLK